MTRLLTNGVLTLRPATLQDKKKIFNWLANSNLTSEMLGLPKFPDNPVPTWEEFDNDYHDYFFDGSRPLKGHCFVLEYNGQEIGQINYGEIDPRANATEIDIWLADKKYRGKGFGTEAIRMLCHYLKETFDCNTIYIAPSNRNGSAIRSYKKAGFLEASERPGTFVADYEDAVLLVKKQ